MLGNNETTDKLEYDAETRRKSKQYWHQKWLMNVIYALSDTCQGEFQTKVKGIALLYILNISIPNFRSIR